MLALSQLTDNVLASEEPHPIADSLYHNLYFLIADSSRGAYYKEIGKHLRDLHESLPTPGKPLIIMVEWWKNNGKGLISCLNDIASEAGSPVSLYNFSKVQLEALHRYYDATQLLFDLLNYEHCVSNSTRESILEGLFLPTSDIERERTI